MLRLPTAEALEAAAQLLRIELKDQGKTGPFRFTRSQRKLAKLLEQGGRTIVCKTRQEGFSTLGGFWLFVLALHNPGLKFAVVLQRQRPAETRLAEIRKFAVQLGLELVVDQAAKFVLPNGAEIHAIGAQGSAAAEAQTDTSRGDTYAGALFSESAFWRSNTIYQALKPGIGEGPILIESTAAGAFGFFWSIWSDETNDFKKCFVGIEESERCVSEPDTITDQQWTEMQVEFGFTSRPHAAWWVAECKAMGGDTHGMLYEYPILPEHPFRTAKGLWVHAKPKVLEPLRTTASDICIFAERDPQLRYIQTYDVSEGVGGDHAVTVILRRDTGALVAAWDSNVIPTDGQEERVKELYRMYAPDIVIVDSIGVGASAVPRLRAAGLPVLSLKTQTGEKYQALLASKRAIERGVLLGPQILEDESGELTVRMGPRGTRIWTGRKDALMACGYGLEYIRLNPWKQPPPPNTMQRYLAQYEQQRQGPSYYGG